MQEDQFTRTRLLLGDEALDKLKNSRVAVFGVGGVGGYVLEALARCGVGSIDLIDNDVVAVSNINRQIIATYKTIGRYKTEAAAERIADINPECAIKTYNLFYLPETAGEIDMSVYDHVVDAIDTVTGKLCIIENAQRSGVPVISALGAGNKLDPTAFEVADIYETSVCPLAKVMRHECKKRGIKTLKCVYSKEKPAEAIQGDERLTEGDLDMSSDPEEKGRTKRPVPGTVSFVPSVAGLIIAGEVIKDLTLRR